MRAEYARRREVVVRALDGLPLRGDTAGLHLVVDVPEPEARRISAAAGERGVLVETLERHHMGPSRASGLVIGYGSAATTTELRKGCEIVRALAG
jgi:GntR family transcriptional regulator/MocR family aminotransferase